MFSVTQNEVKRVEIAAKALPKVRYIIAITPRSGSSYLCDVLTHTRSLGKPGEMFSRQFIPNYLKVAPAHSSDEYLSQILKVMQTGTASGLKASWFQFNDFRTSMQNPELLTELRYIYLTRRDLAAQAVSLYRATATDVFHTNIKHSEEKLKKLKKLKFDYEKIDFWSKHIEVQERGWRDYFANHRIYPLCINYEEIEEDAATVVKRIFSYLSITPPAKPASAESVFRKLGERANLRWACKFQMQRYDALHPDEVAEGADAEAGQPAKG
jgi:LPS sulfotransferase NodH